ncbi:hypothetical protein RRG08_024893 [Elysia crispata]|uniref:Uncharacterized protein n=1 Tax=Elysia crispata TaxID=231223 RepID=A0AAE0YJ35_9GAST|nr:hypothetical protein RRG08_024893 [Elysia crispata]
MSCFRLECFSPAGEFRVLLKWYGMEAVSTVGLRRCEQRTASRSPISAHLISGDDRRLKLFVTVTVLVSAPFSLLQSLFVDLLTSLDLSCKEENRLSSGFQTLIA